MSGVSAVGGGAAHAMGVSEKLSSAHAGPVAKPPGPPEAGEGPSPFARMVHGLGQEIKGGEAMMRHASQSAGSLDTSDLIALQAGVYRYSEAIDLTSRLVEHVTSGLKTVLQGS